MVKNPPANAGDIRDLGLIPRLGRSPGGGNGNPFWYSCLENPMDRGVWRAVVHGVAESDMTQTHTQTHTYTHTSLYSNLIFYEHLEHIYIIHWKN